MNSTPGRFEPPIPVSILTGFLGAGKTTLLNRLVRDPALADAAVIINEFGEVGLDHLLIEHADDEIIEMSSGCLCCTIKGDLVRTLGSLMERRTTREIKRFDRIVIETTGLADPAPVMHTIMGAPYVADRVRLESVITVVDALTGAATLDTHMEAVRQIAVADRIVLSKVDMIKTADERAAFMDLRLRIEALNPAAPILDAAAGEAVANRLFNAGLYNPETKTADVKAWLAEEAYRNRDHGEQGDGHHHHDPNRHGGTISAYCITSNNPIAGTALELFLELVRAQYGQQILRMKGIVKIEEDPVRPVVIHGVQHVYHPPVRLDRWPDGDERSRLVFITCGVDKAQIEGLFAAFGDRLTGSGAAFADKTLSVTRPGGVFR